MARYGYMRNGRDVRTRRWHRKLSSLSARLQVRRGSFTTRDPRRHYTHDLLRRAWRLTPDDFAHYVTRAEANRLRYFARDAEIRASTRRAA